jgi:hypothetical protein
MIIGWATADRQYGFVHSAAIARDDGLGILLAGGSGSGKSTSTAALILAGAKTAGDDSVLVDRTADGFTAYAAYDSLKVDPRSLRLLDLPPADIPAVGAGLAKHMLLLTEVAPSALIAKVAVRAIVLPRIAHAARSIISPTTAAAAQLALGPPSAHLMRVAARATYERAAVLARALPSFRMDLSEDPHEVARSVRNMLERL